MTLNTDPVKYDASTGTMFQALHRSVDRVYECKNKGQLVKYDHAAPSSHQKRTFVAAAKVGYLKGFPGLDTTQ